MHGDTIPYQDGYTVLTVWEPHGVTAHIVPWNYPLQILGRSVGGALAMGNACVIKPAEDASLSAIALAGCWWRRGCPRGPSTSSPGLARRLGGAGRASRHQPHQLHRQPGGGHAGAGGGGAQHHPGDDGTRRQVAATGVRRRRPRRGGAGGGERRDPERRPDLQCRRPRAGRGPHLRSLRGRPRRRASRSWWRGRPSATWTSGRSSTPTQRARIERYLDIARSRRPADCGGRQHCHDAPPAGST